MAKEREVSTSKSKTVAFVLFRMGEGRLLSNSDSQVRSEDKNVRTYPSYDAAKEIGKKIYPDGWTVLVV